VNGEYVRIPDELVKRIKSGKDYRIKEMRIDVDAEHMLMMLEPNAKRSEFPIHTIFNNFGTNGRIGSSVIEITFDFIDGKFYRNSPSQRIPIRAGKVIKSAFNISDNNKIREYTDKLNAFFSDKRYPVKVTTDVERIYNMPVFPSGSIGNSCMNGDGEYYEVLKELFGDRLKIAYVERNGHLLGRALVWENVWVDAVQEYGTYVDRAYGANRYVEFAFHEFAKKNGYYKKYHDCYEQGGEVTILQPNGETVLSNVWTNYKNDDIIFSSYNFPYLDTFKVVGKRRLLNDDVGADEVIGIADQTDGELREAIFCDSCGYLIIGLNYENDEGYVLCENCL